jgi:hypothetical protein
MLGPLNNIYEYKYINSHCTTVLYVDTLIKLSYFKLNRIILNQIIFQILTITVQLVLFS